MKKMYLFLAIASLVLVATAIPLVFQKISPNQYYGVRTHTTLSNLDNWYKTNKLYGECMVLGGFAFFAVSLLTGSWKQGRPDFINFGLLAIQVVVPTLISLIYSNYYINLNP